MKKFLIVFSFLVVLLVGCGKDNIVKTYEDAEGDGRLKTYYEMNDGTWKCNDTSYQFRLELKGRMSGAVSDSCFVILTDNENLTFEDVFKSLISSSLEDSKIMQGSVIVEMN